MCVKRFLKVSMKRFCTIISSLLLCGNTSPYVWSKFQFGCKKNVFVMSTKSDSLDLPPPCLAQVKSAALDVAEGIASRSTVCIATSKSM